MHKKVMGHGTPFLRRQFAGGNGFGFARRSFTLLDSQREPLVEQNANFLAEIGAVTETLYCYSRCAAFQEAPVLCPKTPPGSSLYQLRCKGEESWGGSACFGLVRGRRFRQWRLKRESSCGGAVSVEPKVAPCR